jgi:hypothetical protein
MNVCIVRAMAGMIDANVKHRPDLDYFCRTTSLATRSTTAMTRIQTLTFSVLAVLFGISAEGICSTQPQDLRRDITAIPAYMAAQQKLHDGIALTAQEKRLIEDVGISGMNRHFSNSLDDQGGPDNFGYSFIDNQNGDTATYSWIELRGDAQATWLSSWFQFDDECCPTPVPLDFGFPFYGITYTQCTPTSNGQIQFGNCSPNGYISCVPNANSPAMIFAYQYDLHLQHGGYPSGTNVVDYRNFGNYVVIEFDSIGYWSCTGGSLKFEVLLYPSGNIKLQYGHMAGGCTMGTVGIQNSSATTYLQYRCYSDGSAFRPLNEGLAIWFGLPDGIPKPVTNAHGTVNGSTVMLTWIDPTEDTNGNPLTPDSILIYRITGGQAQQIGHVTHGIQTFSISNQPDGNLTFPLCAKSGTWQSQPANAVVIVGTPSYASDFEADSGNWVASNLWSWGSPNNASAPQPHSGTHCWGTGMSQNYGNSVCENLDLYPNQRVTSPNATLEFWAWWSTYPFGGYDGCNVKVSVDSGANWQTVVPEGGYDSPSTINTCFPGDGFWSGTSNGWEYMVLPLGQFLNQVPAIRLTFGSLSFTGGQYPGFFVDDMTIWGLSPRQCVQGRVRHAGGTNPVLSGVRIWVTGGTDTVVTDNSGNYALWVEPGTYTVNFRHATHCDSVRSTVVVDTGAHVTLDVSLFAPAIALDVSSLTFVVQNADTERQEFSISNPGGACPLSFQLVDSVQWLSCSPAAGTVDPGQSSTITVSVCSSQLPPWEYGATLRVYSNTPDSPRIIHVDMIVAAAVSERDQNIPMEYSLHPNYPNPFNPTTVLPFDVPRLSPVDIIVYNIVGQEVAHPVRGVYAPGSYQSVFDAKDLPSGLYLVKMTAGEFTSLNKIMLLK